MRDTFEKRGERRNEIYILLVTGLFIIFLTSCNDPAPTPISTNIGGVNVAGVWNTGYWPLRGVVGIRNSNKFTVIVEAKVVKTQEGLFGGATHWTEILWLRELTFNQLVTGFSIQPSTTITIKREDSEKIIGASTLKYR